jgi:hypothetical protein
LGRSLPSWRRNVGLVVAKYLWNLKTGLKWFAVNYMYI